MPSLIEIKPKRILIRATNWIGDAIMTTPAVRTIRENFPQAHIAILTLDWVADVFTASPHVDQVILYRKKERHQGIGGLFRLGRELAAQKFDAAILLQNAFEAAFLTCLAGISVRAGYRRDGRSLLLTHGVTIRPEIRKIHQVHYYQTLLRDLGLRCGSDQLFLNFSDEIKQWALGVKTRAGDGPLIGLNPGAAYGPAKCWPSRRYGELALRLQQEMGASLLVFGTGADKDTAREIMGYAPDAIRDMAGKTSLAQAMALIEVCDGFVTNDSGLMHVGAATNTPLAAIFGSTDSVATGPFSRRAVVVQKDLDCSPCMKRTCKADFRCMLDISVDDVFVALEGVMVKEE